MSEVKQVIVMRKDLGMRKGKMIAQGSHASLGSLLKMAHREKHTNGFLSTDVWTRIEFDFPADSVLDKWLNGVFTKVCVYVESEQDLEEIKAKCEAAGIPNSLILDAGLTEFHGVPTKTCLGIGPWWSSEIDKITGSLPLL